MEYTKEITEYIDSAGEDQIPILEELRKLVNDTVINATESIKWSMPVFTGQKNFAYMRYANSHITFGFTLHIDQLKDPGHLLEGEGKTMKHIKITQLDEKLKLQITEWLKQVTA